MYLISDFCIDNKRQRIYNNIKNVKEVEVTEFKEKRGSYES